MSHPAGTTAAPRPAGGGRRAGVMAAVLPTSSALSTLSPLDGRAVSVTSGFWAERLRVNHERTIPRGFAQLREVGTLTNFQMAAEGRKGEYRALGVMFSGPFPFLDSDVYKWLEAVGWELGQVPDDGLTRAADEAIDLIAAAQRQDGYINTFVQLLAPGREYRDLDWGHELYCVGHLIQAAVAWKRALDDDRLLTIATMAADSVDRELGPAGREAIDGHPEIEMALVELYRTTGEARYLELARAFVDRRGRGLLGDGRFGAAYWQDHAPAREAPTVAGHAVRQLYLDCGAVDVAVETADRELLEAVHARWRDMVARFSYLTGGLGSRHHGEAFGDPYELPPDRAYAETCASIASVMLAWRLLLATGDPACADVIERTIHNGVLSGLALDGTSFFYVNPLQRRTERAAGETAAGRQAWYACACCPPNLMRLLGSWPHYLATTDESGIQVHQYVDGELAAATPGGSVRLLIATGLPWQGSAAVRILETPGETWTLSLRIPAWSRGATVDGRPVDGEAVRETRSWRAGETIELGFDMAPRVVEPDPKVDAVRGCVAIERGPLVYCLETVDAPAGVALEELEVGSGVEPQPAAQPELGDDVVGLRLPAFVRGRPGPSATTTAIPYFAWANRSPGAMRVWLPARNGTLSDR